MKVEEDTAQALAVAERELGQSTPRLPAKKRVRGVHLPIVFFLTIYSTYLSL
jgi:hypothetical protein